MVAFLNCVYCILFNNIRYKYAFSADATKVYQESLDAYYTQKPTNIFTRTNTNKYTWIDSFIITQIFYFNLRNYHLIFLFLNITCNLFLY